MLTREKAKEKQCPFRNSSATSDFKKTFEKPEHFMEWTRCTAEDCPNWKDEFIRDNPCKEFPCEKRTIPKSELNLPDYDRRRNATNRYLEHCQTCPKHFGRCS